MFSKGRTMNEKYLELINLMQVPVIEQVILAKLIEIKALLKDEITAFYDKKSKENLKSNLNTFFPLFFLFISFVSLYIFSIES